MLLASFLGFLLLFLLIGFSSVLVRSKEQSDYLLAGSSVPPSLIGLSAVATNNSGFISTKANLICFKAPCSDTRSCTQEPKSFS